MVKPSWLMYANCVFSYVELADLLTSEHVGPLIEFDNCGLHHFVGRCRHTRSKHLALGNFKLEQSQLKLDFVAWVLYSLFTCHLSFDFNLWCNCSIWFTSCSKQLHLCRGSQWCIGSSAVAVALGRWQAALYSGTIRSSGPSESGGVTLGLATHENLGKKA